MLFETLEKNGLNTARMVGFSSDTCNVMFGVNHSVSTLLRQKVPQIITIKCGCHLLHLCSSYASKVLPDHLEDLLRTITSHFSHSPKAKNALSAFQDEMKLAILSPGQTRWLTREASIKRVISEYDALVAYFKNLMLTDKCNTNRFILQSLEDPITMIYFHFLAYALGLFNTVNRIFQSETPLLHTLKPQIESTIEIMARNFMQVHDDVQYLDLDVNDTSLYLPPSAVYLGIFSYVIFFIRFEVYFVYLACTGISGSTEISEFSKSLTKKSFELKHRLTKLNNMNPPPSDHSHIFKDLTAQLNGVSDGISGRASLFKMSNIL